MKPDYTQVASLSRQQSQEKNSKVNGRLETSQNTDFIEDLYLQWKKDPEQVDTNWRTFFEGFELGLQVAPPLAGTSSSSTGASIPADASLKQAGVYSLIFAYRFAGHLSSDIDPLKQRQPKRDELSLKRFGLNEADLASTFDSSSLAGGGQKTLREIISILEHTYTQRIGVEFMHIQDNGMRSWLQDNMESTKNESKYDKTKKVRLLNYVMQSEIFESFLHTRYVGQKRFSLEGGETLIAMLDHMIENCPEKGVKQVVIGMAHRGRLNVLVNVMGKSYQQVFSEFHENYVPNTPFGNGDVKYHLGYDGSYRAPNGEIVGLSLAPNPSHLELVNPVVEGKARAYQRRLNDMEKRTSVLPVLIHGDAAMIGQGIVAETFNMAKLKGYETGGTIHLVINNQIGFTTIPKNARSTEYCTAYGKAFDLPIFHVNGDDPLACALVMDLALKFRQEFKTDVIIDMWCYRKYGHNEGDEPMFTQPTMYTAIKTHPPVSKIFTQQLVEEGAITESDAQEIKTKFEKLLQEHLEESKNIAEQFKPALRQRKEEKSLLETFKTAISESDLKSVSEALVKEPVNFNLNPKIKKWLEARKAMLDGKDAIDWSLGEALAFASLLKDNVSIRVSGQDACRATFSQRHAVFYDLQNEEPYVVFKHLYDKQGVFCIYDSPLSEAAVLGFDYGYTLDYPNMLCIWEAQFGDFANGAQNVIDQYIASAESKWDIHSGIVLFLPHGYHGQGPEHSSARLERFLQSCAEDNIQVAYCSTPAQQFHILRRQALRDVKKPLVLMTPKGLLRDKRCTSQLDDFTKGSFQEILDDPTASANTKRLIFCTGKVYHDLDAHRKEHNMEGVTIVRIEQLYPFHEERVKELFAKYGSAEKVIWCQEEPRNMGAWYFVEPRLRKILGREIEYVGRTPSASPATGSHILHDLEQEDLIERALSH
jgi:2-oxoglutarate dehydrogenase E1 component